MYLERPHLRFDGLYVSRNTYIRTGVTEWRVKNPVHLVCYYRYFRCADMTRRPCVPPIVACCMLVSTGTVFS